MWSIEWRSSIIVCTRSHQTCGWLYEYKVSDVSSRQFPEPEKVTKQEFELFKKIAEDRAIEWHVLAKHIWREWERGINPLWMKLMTFKRWEEGYKFIPLSILTHWNFDHTTPKSRGKDYKLDPENIQIVSVAWHFWKTNWQLLQIDYPN